MAIEIDDAKKIFRYIVGDFEAAWGALVDREGRHSGGGNYLFALLSMILLEFACRVCAKDDKGQKLKDLTSALGMIEKRYFTPLPGPCCVAMRDFTLPGENPQSHLLGAIFDLIRNGKSHQYQAAIVKLKDGEIGVAIGGASSDYGLTKPGRRRPSLHLGYEVCASGDLMLYIRPDQLFLDIKKAIEDSLIIGVPDAVTDVARPRATNTWKFKIADVEQSLINGGHLRRRKKRT